MDADRFDTLARSLIVADSRRRALALALSGALTALLPQMNAAAHDALKGCKKKSGKQKKKCIKKARKHNASHDPCGNGVKDGAESDVDCGGSCPRCALGKSCVSRNDCATALCSGQTCVACTNRFECGAGATGKECFCSTPVGGGPAVCHEGESTGGVSTCDDCPVGTICKVEQSAGNKLFCYKRCGAA